MALLVWFSLDCPGSGSVIQCDTQSGFNAQLWDAFVSVCNVYNFLYIQDRLLLNMHASLFFLIKLKYSYFFAVSITLQYLLRKLCN